MKDKTEKMKIAVSEFQQRAMAIVRVALNLVQILGSSALAAYLVVKYDDKIVLAVAAGIAAYGLIRLVKTAYIAELKVAPRK